MIFAEQKKGDEYYYFLEDVMGEIEINSPHKLTSTQLDSIVVKVMSLRVKSGKLKLENVGEVEYKYKKMELWE